MVCVHAKGDIDAFRYVETYLRFEEESFCIAFLVEIDGRAYVGYDERLDLVCPYASEAGADENRDDTFISVMQDPRPFAKVFDLADGVDVAEADSGSEEETLGHSSC